VQFVGFGARPVGAAIFGHYGDRIGRKATLITTLLLMGIGDA
jgi:MFS family permease